MGMDIQCNRLLRTYMYICGGAWRIRLGGAVEERKDQKPSLMNIYCFLYVENRVHCVHRQELAGYQFNPHTITHGDMAIALSCSSSAAASSIPLCVVSCCIAHWGWEMNNWLTVQIQLRNGPITWTPPPSLRGIGYLPFKLAQINDDWDPSHMHHSIQVYQINL